MSCGMKSGDSIGCDVFSQVLPDKSFTENLSLAANQSTHTLIKPFYLKYIIRA